MNTADLARHEFEAVVGREHVLVDPGVRATVEQDWTGRFQGRCAALLRPGSAAEVAGLLAICDRRRIGVVPQGGNTGLVGGAVPRNGQVVLSTGRMRTITVDAQGATLRAGAGATLASVQVAAHAAGFTYPVDFASRDTATIGGTVATNAGGVGVLRHGTTRDQLAGIAAVRADGTVLSDLRGLRKDNTGYDLAGLLCGSEGTLAVVTDVMVRLVAPAGELVTALVGFSSLRGAVGAAQRWRHLFTGLEALELIGRDGVDLVCAVEELPRPLVGDAAAYVLVEMPAGADVARLAVEVTEADGATGSSVATDTGTRAALWRYREGQTTALNTLGAPHKMDVSLPATTLAGFLETIADLVRAVEPEAAVWCFGHVGDGNIHVNVTGVDPDRSEVDQVVLERVAALGGSISAEHGIGAAKRRWLHLARGPAEIETFRRIKRALDPNGILNPGVLLPPE